MNNERPSFSGGESAPIEGVEFAGDKQLVEGERFRPNNPNDTVVEMPDFMPPETVDRAPEETPIEKEKRDAAEETNVEEAQKAFSDSWPEVDKADARYKEVRRKTWAENGYFGGGK